MNFNFIIYNQMEMQGRKIKISGVDNEISEEPWTFVAKGHFCALL